MRGDARVDAVPVRADDNAADDARIDLLAKDDALAQIGGLPAVTSAPAAGGGTTYSLTIQTLLLMTALTFIPAAVLMMTGFTRIVIVLSLLRHALGTQTSPPNQIIVGLSLFLTFFVMSPVRNGRRRCVRSSLV